MEFCEVFIYMTKYLEPSLLKIPLLSKDPKHNHFFFFKIALRIKIVKVLNQKPERQYELQLHKPSARDSATAAP